MVVDNAASLAAELHAWLSELADHEARLGGEAPPLRLLILERSAVPGEGWWAEAFGRGGDATAIARLLDSLEPDTLAAISDATERRDIFLAAYRRLIPSSLEGDSRRGAIPESAESRFKHGK